MLSRFTEPGRFAPMLDELPDDPRAIAAVARAQTIHHNLLAYFGVGGEPPRVWPPRLDAMLGALAETPPGTLSLERSPEQRILGACVLGSHFLAGLLRHRGRTVRIRVGYFRNIRENQEHVVAFWAHVARAKGVEALEAFNAYSQRQNDLDRDPVRQLRSRPVPRGRAGRPLARALAAPLGLLQSAQPRRGRPGRSERRRLRLRQAADVRRDFPRGAGGARRARVATGGGEAR